MVGEEEKKAGLVNVRTRDNHVHGMHSLERVVDVLLQERGSRSITSSFGEGASGCRAPCSICLVDMLLKRAFMRLTCRDLRKHVRALGCLDVSCAAQTEPLPCCGRALVTADCHYMYCLL